MSHDNHHKPGFECEESWLNEQLQDSDKPNTDFIKLRMRIEVQEQWLRHHLHQEDLQADTVDLRQALRNRIRQEIKHQQADQTRTIRRRIMGWPLWVGGAVAAAAAIIMVISKPPIVDEALADESTIWLSAFEAYATDAFGYEMSDFDNELSNMANSLVALDDPWLADDWTSEPTELDENDTNHTKLQEKSRNQGERTESGT